MEINGKSTENAKPDAGIRWVFTLIAEITLTILMLLLALCFYYMNDFLILLDYLPPDLPVYIQNLIAVN